MFCSRMGNGIPITCTTTYQKWTGQPIHLAGSKNPLPLGMGSVNNSFLALHPYKITLLSNINSYHRNGEIGYIGHSIFLMTQKEFSDCIDELRDGDYVFVIK